MAITVVSELNGNVGGLIDAPYDRIDERTGPDDA